MIPVGRGCEQSPTKPAGLSLLSTGFRPAQDDCGGVVVRAHKIGSGACKALFLHPKSPPSDPDPTSATTTESATSEPQQPAIPLTTQLSSMRSVSSRSARQAPVSMDVSSEPPGDTIDYAHGTQDPKDRVVK